MAIPNIFISHRWAYSLEYNSLVSKFNQYNFHYSNYSVPTHNPLDVNRVYQIKNALKEQIRQCNYFLIFSNMAMGNSRWCKFEVEAAQSYNKPILAIRPHSYSWNTPLFIQLAETEGGVVGFNAPSIIRKICRRLNHPIPLGI